MPAYIIPPVFMIGVLVGFIIGMIRAHKWWMKATKDVLKKEKPK